MSHRQAIEVFDSASKTKNYGKKAEMAIVACDKCKVCRDKYHCQMYCGILSFFM